MYGRMSECGLAAITSLITIEIWRHFSGTQCTVQFFCLHTHIMHQASYTCYQGYQPIAWYHTQDVLYSIIQVINLLSGILMLTLVLLPFSFVMRWVLPQIGFSFFCSVTEDNLLEVSMFEDTFIYLSPLIFTKIPLGYGEIDGKSTCAADIGTQVQIVSTDLNI